MALVASLVASAASAIFAVRLVGRWQASGRASRPLLAWSISVSMFCIASVMLLAGVVLGWSTASFRAFYLFGAALNVPWLALGSVLVNAHDRFTSRATGVVTALVGGAFLPGVSRGEELAITGAALAIAWGLVQMTGRKELVEQASVALVVVYTVVAAVVIVMSDLGPLAMEGLPEGREVFGQWARSFAVGGNATGSIIVIVGGILSTGHLGWRALDTRRQREVGAVSRRRLVDGLALGVLDGWRALRPAGLRDIAIGNLLIALGVVFAAGSGGMFSFLGDTTAHAVGLGVGVLVMYGGFDRTTRRPRTADEGRLADSASVSS